MASQLASRPYRLTARDEKDLRDAFELALSYLKQGDEIAYADSQYNDERTSMVLVVIGPPMIKKAESALNRLMDQIDKARLGKR